MSNFGNEPSQPTFEHLRQLDPDGEEFWSARDLMSALDYSNWRNFKVVLSKAQIACKNSGYDTSNHFFNATQIIANKKREIEDFHLSRYACYLIIQNANAAKKVVATAQTYIALKTRHQEVADDLHHEKIQHILDHMGTTELAANLFRSTQAEDKLRREQIKGKEAANQVHYEAGVVVRRAIAELGGTMPEDLPTVESIKKLERAEKKRLTPAKSKSKKGDEPME